MTNPAPSVVLLVQGDENDRTLYGEVLQQAGFRVMSVPDGVRALTVAPSAAVIVTGLLLRGAIDGVTLLTRLKRHESTRHIPVVVLTWCAWPAERERVEAAGADAFLAKPCPQEALLEKVSQLMTSRADASAPPIGITPPAAS